MKGFAWKHVAAGLALMAVLSLVAPVSAQAAGRGFAAPAAASGGAWAWVTSLWDRFAAMLGVTGGARSHATAKSDASAPAGAPSNGVDWGSMIDPNGQVPPPP
jgi:hypothetical protein